jgi:hypothetical protein
MLAGATGKRRIPRNPAGKVAFPIISVWRGAKKEVALNLDAPLMLS